MNPSLDPLPLSPGRKMLRMAAVGVIVGSVAVAFAFAGGWLTPRKLSPDRVVDTFERINGQHPGFRRNHAKGVGAAGTFESNGAGEKYSKAAVFKAGSYPVVGRFAYAGGMPYAGDAPGTVRSLALQILLPGNQEWRMGLVNIPVFVVKTPAGFVEQLTATAPDPATGKPDPARLKAFTDAHPEFVHAVGIIKAQPPTSGFEDSTYNALNAFFFTNADGKTTPVRWSLVPETKTQPPATQPEGDTNYMFDRLIHLSKQGPLKWHLVLTIGQPGDPTDDASSMWPDDREKVDVGTVVIDRIEAEETSPARTVNYDPTVLPDGIAVSDDPLLSARSAAYSKSFTRRAGEPTSQSAVTPAEVSHD